MAKFTVADIKALRQKTGAGMLDVKKALEEAGGDIAKAEEAIRVKGLKAVAKREGRTAANGLVASAVTDVDGGQRGAIGGCRGTDVHACSPAARRAACSAAVRAILSRTYSSSAWAASAAG